MTVALSWDVIGPLGAEPDVVAPIAPAGRVIGFFHADHRIGGRPCDTTDRDVLWRFAEGFGHLFERTALHERLRGRRHEIDDMLDIDHDAMDHLTAAELRLSAASESEDPDPSRPATDRGAVPDTLTAREREVLSHLVAGRRNRETHGRSVSDPRAAHIGGATPNFAPRSGCRRSGSTVGGCPNPEVVTCKLARIKQSTCGEPRSRPPEGRPGRERGARRRVSRRA